MDDLMLPVILIPNGVLAMNGHGDDVVGQCGDGSLNICPTESERVMIQKNAGKHQAEDPAHHQSKGGRGRPFL